MSAVMGLKITPCTLKAANRFVGELHRHADPTQGHKFSIAVLDETGAVRGVAIVGRPTARHLDDGTTTAEITRVCTDGTRNACSMLYGAARRAAKAMGYERVVTYTLAEETGISLRAAGFRVDCERAGGTSAHWHNREGRKARPVGKDLVGGKIRWVS